MPCTEKRADTLLPGCRVTRLHPRIKVPTQGERRVQAERRRYWRPETLLEAYPAKMVRHSAAGAVLAGVLLGVAMFVVQIAIDRTVGHTRQTLWYSDMFMGMLTAIATGAGLLHYRAHLAADR